jgi:hypothetical protein
VYLLPPLVSEIVSAAQHLGSQESESLDDSQPPHVVIEMVICSFALHLVESSSQLFSSLGAKFNKVKLARGFGTSQKARGYFLFK